MMTALIEKYIKPGKISAIGEEKKFDAISTEEFIRFLDFHLQEDEKYGYDDEDHEASMLEYAGSYIDDFMKEREKGFSVDWAREYTQINKYDDNQNPPALAYDCVRKINPVQALKDLQFIVTSPAGMNYL